MAIIESKWDIKCIQKVLRKILDVFITKKSNQCKTSCTLNIDVYKIPNNKHIRNFFSKYELLFQDQANSSSDGSKILILQSSIPTTFLLPLPFLFNFTIACWNLPSTHPHRVLHRLPCFSLAHSTTCHHKYWIYQTIWQAKPIKLIIKLYQDQNNLWVKDANHQKAESLRTRSAITIYLIQSMLNSVQNGRYFFIITNLLVHTTTLSIYTKNLFVYFSQFLCPYFNLICSQNHP